MKTLIALAALAALTLQAQTPAPAKAEPGAAVTESPDPDRLTPAHTAKWKELVDDLESKTAASEKAELIYLRAKEDVNRSLTENRAAVLKMQTEANCPRCTFSLGPDGVVRWVRSQPKTEEKKEK